MLYSRIGTPSPEVFNDHLYIYILIFFDNANKNCSVTSLKSLLSWWYCIYNKTPSQIKCSEARHWTLNRLQGCCTAGHPQRSNPVWRASLIQNLNTASSWWNFMVTFIPLIYRHNMASLNSNNTFPFLFILSCGSLGCSAGFKDH